METPPIIVDLTQSPVSKPKQTENVMAVDSPEYSVKRTVTSTGGTRVSTKQRIKPEETEETEEGMDLCYSKAKRARVLSESDPDVVSRDSLSTRVLLEGCSRYVDSVKEELGDGFGDLIDAEPISVCKVEKMDDLEVKQSKLDTDISSNTLCAPSKLEGSALEGSVKKEYDMMDQKPKLVSPILSKSHTDISSNTLRASSNVEGSVLEGSVKKEYDGVDQKPKLVKPVSSVRPDLGYVSGLSKKGQKVVEDRKVSLVGIETGDFEEEADWLLVGRTAITGLSTTKGRKLEDNEIVHFAFPNGDVKVKSGYWANSRGGSAACGIVRFSTKRSGEIGRLPMEWSKCLIPLVLAMIIVVESIVFHPLIYAFNFMHCR